jgi:hypothetical protein
VERRLAGLIKGGHLRGDRSIRARYTRPAVTGPTITGILRSL